MSEAIEYKGLTIVEGIVVAPLLVVEETLLNLNYDEVDGKIAVIRIASPSIVLWLRRASGLVVENWCHKSWCNSSSRIQYSCNCWCTWNI